MIVLGCLALPEDGAGDGTRTHGFAVDCARILGRDERRAIRVRFPTSPRAMPGSASPVPGSADRMRHPTGPGASPREVDARAADATGWHAPDRLVIDRPLGAGRQRTRTGRCSAILRRREAPLVMGFAYVAGSSVGCYVFRQTALLTRAIRTSTCEGVSGRARPEGGRCAERPDATDRDRRRRRAR